MPWFCHATSKKKRSSKTRVGSVGKVRQDANTLSEDRPAFAVMLQSFASSIGDELTVQRGQVVEVMYHDGDWTFVRNLDASSGYVPKMYCLSMDNVKGDFNNSMLDHVTGPLPRPRVINVDTLQRSGSSVNSVEVHQVTSTSGLVSENSEPDASTSRTSSSSQVIYEIPKAPAQRYSGGSNSQPTPAQRYSGGFNSQPTPEVLSEVVTPSSFTRAPSLPPRSVNLPSPAEIQRQWAPSSKTSVQRPGFLPGCHQNNPFTVALQGTPTQQQSSSYRSTVGQSTGIGSGMTPHFSGGSASQQATPPTHPTMTQNSPVRPHPLNIGHTDPGCSTHSAENSPSSILNSARHSPATSHNPDGVNPGRRHAKGGVAAARSHPHIRGLYPQADFPDHVACTPGSAGVPAVAPSPISARVAMTPGSPGMSSAITPGYATKPARFAATPSGASGVETNSQWPMGDADSTPPSCNQRTHCRRFRRHSSDVMLLESSISEDSNVITYHSPPQTVVRNSRRQSQPCVTNLGLHSPKGHPTRPLVRRSLSMQEPQEHGHSPHVQSIPIHRAASYQEAVLCEEEKNFGATASLKPSELLEQSARTPGRQSCDHKRLSHDHRHSDRCQHAGTPNLEPADPDDVFLPDGKKPFGIFRCMRDYQQKFKGEISLKKNELVIVLDRGKGEWAWAITSSNSEGLIPKSVLVRYEVWSGSLNRKGRERSDAGTQTDKDTIVCSDSGGGASCNDTVGVSCSVGNSSINVGCNASTSSNSHKRGRTDSAPADIESSNLQSSCPKEWFDTLDSVDAAMVVTRINSEPSHAVPPSSHDQPTEHVAKPPPAKGRATASKIPKLKKATSVPHDVSSRPQPVESGTVHYHDRISGMGSVNFESTPSPPSARKSSTRPLSQRPSHILTAIKDYNPPDTSQNCLSLKKGDTLHLQPHMHYPKGWMWVWHTKRRSFGFVPKSCVAYTYDTPQRERRDTIEDAV